MPAKRLPNRWLIAAAGLLMQLCLGSTYAWSVFTKPLMADGWTQTQVTLAFTIAVVFIGVGSLVGGMWQDRKGPRLVATFAGFCYGIGFFITSFSSAHHSLIGVYIGYGFFGGMGMGIGYICPVAVIAKWFPEKRGLMTGSNVMGFGACALIMGPIAARLLTSIGAPMTFATFGVAYMIIVVAMSQTFVNPPEGWHPEGWEPTRSAAKTASSTSYTVSEALKTWRFWLLWLMLSLNTSAGIMILSQASPLAQQQTKITAIAAATVVGILAIFNATGRAMWGWISDYIGCSQSYIILFALQVFLFLTLPSLHDVVLFTIAASLIAMCYGGGFGIMPSFTADFFGPKYVGGIYGWVLLGWGFASVPSPLLMAHIHDTTGTYDYMIYVIGFVMVISILFPILSMRIRSAMMHAATARVSGKAAV